MAEGIKLPQPLFFLFLLPKLHCQTYSGKNAVIVQAGRVVKLIVQAQDQKTSTRLFRLQHCVIF